MNSGPSSERGRPDEEQEASSLVADEPPPGARLEEERKVPERSASLLGLYALGIVYGDIGTSPIYAFRESFHGSFPIAPNPVNVLGVLSMVVWSLLVVVSLKYLYYILRAENEGQGGILALAALLNPWNTGRRIVVILGLFGAALLLGDGMITPAISVLSAVEGLHVAIPGTEPWVLPIAIVILIALFAVQRRGTTRVGALFGPVMAVWFLVIAALGVPYIIERPEVLGAVNPLHAAHFFQANGVHGFFVLGAVFLVVTGGEALYADLGHFGSRPIRLGWFAVVLPALLLSYFGQGALLLGAPTESQPFYAQAPGWTIYPVVILATAATIIASQAVISGVFSLTRQAIQLGQFPYLRVEQTSEEDIGRVYVPAMNWIMMVATIGLVLSFRSSSGLAAAYGVAVSTTFVITTLLAFWVAREIWGWSNWAAAAVTMGFLVVDLAFFGANIVKIPDGGWFPLLVAGIVLLVMTTWARGVSLMAGRADGDEGRALDDFMERLRRRPPPRVPGCGVFVGGPSDDVTPLLERHVEHDGALHETVLVVHALTSNVPAVPFANRLDIDDLGEGVYRVVAHYGFMQQPNVPVVVKAVERAGVPMAEGEPTYYVGRRVPSATDDFVLRRWRMKLFTLIARNSPTAEDGYNLPPDRRVDLGIRVEV